MKDIVPAVLLGAAFGWSLHKGGLTHYARIVNIYRLRDLTVLRFMLTALLVGSVGIRLGLELAPAVNLPLPASALLANAAGGVVFGIGMAAAGYCPGTIAAEAGEGRVDAWLAGLSGLLCGALLFGWLQPYVMPAREEPVPHLNFAPLENALDRLRSSARAYDRASAGKQLPRDAQVALDRVLMGLERALTRPEGLPGRPWYVHHVYAPGLYTGYGVKTLPGVREAIELRKWRDAEEQIVVLSRVLENYAAEIDRATAVFR